MITCKLYGRFGNMGFQIATTIAHAERYGFKWAIPQSTINRDIWPDHPMTWLPVFKDDAGVKEVWKESSHNYTEIPARDGLILDGYFQSHKYIDDSIPILRKYFGLEENTTLKRRCYLHTRKGDYVKYPDKHPVLPFSYYEEAIKLCKSNLIIICGDDQSHMYELENYLYDKLPVGYVVSVKQLDYYTDFKNLANCDELIISNSSFSLLAAILNNKAETIISPDHTQWFGSGNAHLNTSDMLPEKFIQIKY